MCESESYSFQILDQRPEKCDIQTGQSDSRNKQTIGGRGLKSLSRRDDYGLFPDISWSFNCSSWTLANLLQ